MSKQYLNLPKVNLKYPTDNVSYCIISYNGNTAATSYTVSSGSITTGSYVTSDLSFNTLYTFKLVPYNIVGVSGQTTTITIDTTPIVYGTKSTTKSTYSSAQLQWTGSYNNYSVARSAYPSGAYVDVSTNVKNNYYYDNDLSGNTVYYYYIKSFDAGSNLVQTTSTITVYTNVRAPTDLSYIFVDSSAVSLKWVTRNSYNTSYYNTVYCVSGSTVITSASGDIQSSTLTGLSKNTTYSAYAQTYLLSESSAVTVTTASPYIGGNITLYSVSMNSITVAWSGQYYDRVDVYRKYGATSYTTVSGDYYYYYPSWPYPKYYCSFNTTDACGQYIYDYATSSYDIKCSVATASSALSTTYFKYGTSSFSSTASNYYFTLPSFTTNGSAMTVMFYAYFTSAAATNDVLRCFDFGNGIALYNIQSWIQYTGGTNLSIQYNLNTNGISGWQYSYNYVYPSYTLGTWVNIAYVISGTNVTFYVNGTSVYTTAASVFPTTITRTSNRLGYSNWGETSATTAYMEEFYVFDAALNASQITSYMNISKLGEKSSNKYVDGDISGNTTYYYYVVPKVSVFSGAASSVVSATTPAQAATGLSSTFVDSSGIQIAFTAPKNSYTSTYYYQLNAVYSGTTTSVSGSTSPLFVKGLAEKTTYTCYILSYLDGILGATSYGYTVSTSVSDLSYTYLTDMSFINSDYYSYGSITPTLTNGFYYNKTGNFLYLNGYYTISASSQYDGNWPPSAFWATSYSTGFGSSWVPTTGGYSNGVYVGTTSSTTTTGTVKGEYVQIKLPFYLKLQSYTLSAAQTNIYVPYSHCILGSTDGSTWVNLSDISYGSTYSQFYTTVAVTTTDYYNYFRYVLRCWQPGQPYAFNVMSKFYGTVRFIKPKDYSFYYFVNTQTAYTLDYTNTYTMSGVGLTSAYPSGNRTYNITNTQVSIISYIFGSSYTICFWIYENALSGSFLFKSSTSDIGPVIWNNGGTNMSFSPTYGTNPLAFNAYLKYDNAWSHWAITFDGTTNIATFYRNAIYQTSAVTTTASTPASKTWYFNAGVTTYLNYIMFFNRVLTQFEIGTIYAYQY